MKTYQGAKNMTKCGFLATSSLKLSFVYRGAVLPWLSSAKEHEIAAKMMKIVSCMLPSWTSSALCHRGQCCSLASSFAILGFLLLGFTAIKICANLGKARGPGQSQVLKNSLLLVFTCIYRFWPIVKSPQLDNNQGNCLIVRPRASNVHVTNRLLSFVKSSLYLFVVKNMPPLFTV